MRRNAGKFTAVFNQEEQAWLRLSQAGRMLESARLWKFYRAMGGKLDSQPDPQGPFHFKKT